MVDLCPTQPKLFNLQCFLFISSQFLVKLELNQYVQIFKENHIEMKVLWDIRPEKLWTCLNNWTYFLGSIDTKSNPTCGIAFVSANDLQDHIAQEHESSFSSLSLITNDNTESCPNVVCKICTSKFRTKLI